jgi:hypothetical protein
MMPIFQPNPDDGNVNTPLLLILQRLPNQDMRFRRNLLFVQSGQGSLGGLGKVIWLPVLGQAVFPGFPDDLSFMRAA